MEEDKKERMIRRKRWAIAMSEEIQEILKDFKYFQLHEHLFDADDDLWLSRLDDIFDNPYLDLDFFGKDLSSHYLMISLLSGLLSAPLYLTTNFFFIPTPSSPSSYLYLFAPTSSPFATLFNNSPWALALTFITSLLYLFRPLSTTSLIRTTFPFTHLLVELAATAALPAISLLISKSAMVSTT